MKKLLNTLYITSEDAYLSLNGENIEVNLADGVHAFPLHTIENVVCFSYKGASPALMGKCADYNIQMSFYTPFGRYLASVRNDVNGNVLLRKEQYRISDDEMRSYQIAKNFIIGKLYNSKYVLLRCARDHSMQVDVDLLKSNSNRIQGFMDEVINTDSFDVLRGIEGNAASLYFESFNELILQNKKEFLIKNRNRRPPTDRTNALLSFAYTMLANDYAAALHSVGLDPYIGFMHTDRPGRKSLALDMMEELRSVYADRFVLTLINNRVISKNDFSIQNNEVVLLNDKGRKTFLAEWQKKKKEELKHPYLEEKMTWGLVPYVQSMLLARYIRGDIDQYPPFLWK